ncbi:ABC transporter permease [Brasilonema sp. UFV-L1]|uniref:ABC transporter permease n=1 Tax=Brasilonema sp. UFV-L1 TaxID=2234130 RepID=UPI00145C45E8|nr:ABC transporter permease [Brasilonema sp. UFV-L1]NMG08648.1 ABC transporter [Brasilonema sp. UFV-L1]
MKGPSVSVWGVYSVWHRHAKVYQRTWLVNCLPPLLEPIIHLVAFGYGLMPLIGAITYAEQQIPYLKFIAPGTMAVGVLFHSFLEGAFASFVRIHFQKTWQALLTAPLSFSEVFLGDWLWATTKGMITGTLTGTVAVFWGLYPAWNLLLSLPIMLLGSLVFSAMGLLTAGTVRQSDQINIPIFLLIVPMFTLCGTYFPRQTLPPFLERIASVLPMASFTDLLRWNFGLPSFWWLKISWLLVLMVVFAYLAMCQIYPKLIK